MDSSVLNSLPVLLITAGLALLAASLQLARLSRQHRKRMERLLQLAGEDIEPLQIPAAAWPQLAEAGWQGLAWRGFWFGQAVEGVLGEPPADNKTTENRRMAHRQLVFEIGTGETRLRLVFAHRRSRGEQRLFADQMSRVFLLLLESRLRARSEALAAALAERARLSLSLQHDIRNLAQWVNWISNDLVDSTTEEALLEIASRLRNQAVLAKQQAQRLIAALAQTPGHETPECTDLGPIIVQAAQLAGFRPEIAGNARAWVCSEQLATALDHLFAPIATLWRQPETLPPVFRLSMNGQQVDIAFSCQHPHRKLSVRQLLDPFDNGCPGGTGLSFYQARKHLSQTGGELSLTSDDHLLHCLLHLPAKPEPGAPLNRKAGEEDERLGFRLNNEIG